MSSPARSSASATSVGQGGGSSNNAAFGDDTSPYRLPTDLVTPQERKEEALAVLKSDLMEALQKEVKSLDEDSWMFAGPRSQINLISRPGANASVRLQTGKHGEVNNHFKLARHVQR